MDLKPKVKATADIKKNRLTITMSGNVDGKTLEKLYTDIRFCVCDLSKGFEVINNISQCNILYISSLPVYKKIIDYLISCNVGEIVRVAKDDHVSYKQMANIFKNSNHCKAIIVENENEAAEKLQLLKKRSGIRFKIKGLSVGYETNNGKGQGAVIDLSISGCAIDSPTIPLSPGENMVITIQFEEHDTLSSMFSIKAKTVRVDETKFAAQFLELEDERKEQLYQRLAYEVSRTPFSL